MGEGSAFDMKCLTWNLEWASPSSNRLELILQIIEELNPDIICFTEAILSGIPDGYVISSEPDYGYTTPGKRRKVVLWSKNPWTEIETIGDPELPTGRFAAGVTSGIRFIGVCIPWKDAHVRTGRKDRLPWEDHLTFCDGLDRVLNCYASLPEPICILGDYNQRIPRGNQPQKVYEALVGVFASFGSIVSEGFVDPEGKGLIDHMTVSPNLSARVERILPRFTADGIRLSDHVGVLTEIDEDCRFNGYPGVSG